MTATGAAIPGAPARNGAPPFRPYVRGAPRPPWMLAALAAAEAEHGPPVPTCACGAPLMFTSHSGYDRCAACGWSPGIARPG